MGIRLRPERRPGGLCQNIIIHRLDQPDHQCEQSVSRLLSPKDKKTCDHRHITAILTPPPHHTQTHSTSSYITINFTSQIQISNESADMYEDELVPVVEMLLKI